MRRIQLASLLVVLLPAVSAGADQNLLIGLGFGGVFPTGHFARGYSAGFCGTGSIGVMNGRFGVRLLSGSVEPRTGARADDAVNSGVSGPGNFSLSIVPAELQALYRVPVRRSALAFEFQGGMGGSAITLRRAGTDNRLKDYWRFGMSGGAGLSTRLRDRPGRIAVSGVFHRVFDTPDAIDYGTGELEFTMVF